MEFPVHFRYQAPSRSELYRPASVVAPELFLYCAAAAAPVAATHEQHPAAATSTETSQEVADAVATQHFQVCIHCCRYCTHMLSSEREDHASRF